MKSSLFSTLLLTTLTTFAAGTPTLAEQSSPVCVYASKNYSEGAFLCVQKSIALTCRSDGVQPVWTTVTDKDLTDRCASAEPYSRPHRRLRTALRVHHRSFSIEGAKCFEFNGKRYCE